MIHGDKFFHGGTKGNHYYRPSGLFLTFSFKSYAKIYIKKNFPFETMQIILLSDLKYKQFKRHI